MCLLPLYWCYINKFLYDMLYSLFILLNSKTNKYIIEVASIGVFE